MSRMASIDTTLDALLKQPREDLLDVGLLLERTPEAEIGDVVAAMDLKLRSVYHAVEACRRLLVLYRTPRHRQFDPAEVLCTLAAQVPLRDADPDALQATRRVYGDPEQMLECVRLVSGSVSLAMGGRLRTTLATAEDPPRIVLELQGSGRIPEDFPLEALHELSLDELGERWTAATAGGHLAHTGENMVFYLESDRPPPASVAGLEDRIKTLQRLSRRLRSWRGAIGHFEPGYAAAGEIVQLYRDTVHHAVRALDQVQGRE